MQEGMEGKPLERSVTEPGKHSQSQMWLMWLVFSAVVAGASAREISLVVEQTILAPDGFPRRAITINGRFPGPAIHAVVGEQLEITVVNKLPHRTR